MASIFKRNKRKNTPYTIQYLDHLGDRKTTKGFTDKGLTEQLAAKLESEARMRSTGLIDVESEKTLKQKQLPIKQHLDAFEESLAENSPKHVKLTMGRVRSIVEEAKFQSLGDIESELALKALNAIRAAENLGHRTYNHYLQAFDSFLNWCVPKRLSSNPMAGAERLNTETDIRHQRRALTVDEMSRLIETARNSRRYIQRQSPEQRARIYLFAYSTGLRKKELASLRVSSFRLDATPVTVTIEAACSKHRRKDVIPLHPQLAAEIRHWINGRHFSEKLFPDLEKKKLSFMVKKDLEAAGIAYETHEGIADFHAAGRHTYITQLLLSGASLTATKELARHTDVKMTMRYAHIGLEDQAKALGNLPMPASSQSNPAALHGRCTFGGAERKSEALSGTRTTTKKRKNPCEHKGLVASGLDLAFPVTAEGTGVEPATPCGASDFESDRSPFAYPPRVYLPAPLPSGKGNKPSQPWIDPAFLLRFARL